MPVFRSVWRQVYTAIATASWTVLLGIALLHILACWAFLSAAGENELTALAATWFYYYVVTATTVGYGDLSPATDAGRVLASIFVVPGAIAIFTALLGKAITDISRYWKARLMGRGNYARKQGHVIVMGWQGDRTRRLIEGLINDPADDQPILVAASVQENPMPTQIDFVAVETLSDVKGLGRAGASGAKVIVVRGTNDDETLAATLAAQANAPRAHIVAHFEEDASARLLNGHVANVETVTSVSTDIIVRAACDPGTSRLSRLMFSAATEDTAYALQVPESSRRYAFMDLLINLKIHHGATLIGVRGAEDGEVDLNCPTDQSVGPGDVLYYISDHRLRQTDIRWNLLAGEAA